jgi:hypothetical protein
MLTSMLKTLASTHCSTATKIAAKHKAKIMTPPQHRPGTCFEAVVERGEASTPLVARCGGVSAQKAEPAVIKTSCPDGPPTHAKS